MTPNDRHSRGLLKRLTHLLRRPASVLGANASPERPQSVRLENHIEHEDGEPDLLMPQIVIDGTTLAAFDHGPVDLAELERSLAGNGTFFIWTCTCGSAGCGGRTQGVHVKHSNGVVRWHDRDSRHHYCFRLADIASAFDALTLDAPQALLQQPSLTVTPDQNLPYFGQDQPVEARGGRASRTKTE